MTKACARHGLGLYIYAGEDLPEDEAKADEPQEPMKATSAQVEVILKHLPEDRMAKMMGFYGVARLEDLTKKQAGEVMAKMKKDGLI